MPWSISGSTLSFEVDEHGLSISGQGSQTCRPNTSMGNLTEIAALPGQWSIYRASEATELLSLFSLDMHTMTRPSTMDSVQGTAQPIGIIKYYDHDQLANQPHVSFAIFLPDRYFNHVWELIKLMANNAAATYSIILDFVAFAPCRPERRSDSRSNTVSYQEWRTGRPYIATSFFNFQCSPGM